MDFKRRMMMKKTVILLLMVQMTLLAGVADLQTMYDEKKYREVILEAQGSTDLYGDVKLHLLWAQSAEAMSNALKTRPYVPLSPEEKAKVVSLDEMAMSAYERVLMIDPDDTEVRVHLAMLYAELERDELADEMSKSTENYQLSPAQRTSLESIRGEEDLQKVRASAEIGIGYDSNINVSPGDLDLPTSEDEISTMFVQLKGAVSYTHDLSEEGGWYARGDGNLFYQNNIDADFYNLFAFSVGAGMGYHRDSYDVYLPVTYSRVHFLDRDLLQSVSIDPRINFALSQAFILNANARYTQRSYIEEIDERRNDTVVGGGLGLYWLFARDFAYFKVNLDSYSAEFSDSLLFTNKDTMTASFGVNYHVLDWFITRFDYRYRSAEYDDAADADSDERSDDYHQAEFKVSRMFLDSLEGSLLYRYVRNDSNYALAEYDKSIFMLGLQYNY